MSRRWTSTSTSRGASPSSVRRAGVRLDVLARAGIGLRLLTAARTATDGRWSVDRTFSGTATWDAPARTAADGLNRPGASAPVRMTVR